MKLDVLGIGVHPDDVELSCAGTLLVEKANGKKVGVIDLTEGELGTRGTVATRYAEAADAAAIMQLDARINLQMKDGFFQNNEENQRKLIAAIRQFQPEVILCNALDDRHPDHGRSAKLVADAAFLSGLAKIETTWDGIPQMPWRPKNVFHYIQDRLLEPDFIVDISSVWEQKLKSILAYKTQFYVPDMEGPVTYISTPDFLQTVEGKHRLFGKMIGVTYGEGYQSIKKIGVANLDALIHQTT